ncbi:MAG: SAM-dependent methyltransferase [Candidatus Methanohalarchaeum thermophilum]|uniref:SAM-dependent methyltransferase n=1 Tax=Methanohalarchaeum thermophilum TaxID=1903181 RepID=A0A1Q6DWN0_METT1|nr:MAG: SAM-dependent methyltransferase [Candidatus Methanohalarchaeum thermophilum]
MKGKKWYRKEDIAEEYEPKRFKGLGGKYINYREKKSVKKALGNIKNKKILDVATGTGRFSIMAAEEGGNVTAGDISLPMLEIAKNKAKRKDLIEELDFIKMDAENLPFRDEEFEMVMAIRFMHLVNEPQLFLKEMKRVTQKRIIFDTFSLLSLRVLYNKMLPMGSTLYKKKDIQKIAKNLDLKVKNKIDSFTMPFGFYRYAPDFTIKPIKNLDEKISKNQLGKKLSTVNYWILEKQN